MTYTPKFLIPAEEFAPDDISERALSQMIEALVRIDEQYLEAHPTTTPLEHAKVRYAGDLHEEWRNIPTMLDLRCGGDVDLCAWRAAELRRQGQAASVELDRRSWGVTVYVKWPDGSSERPQDTVRRVR